MRDLRVDVVTASTAEPLDLEDVKHHLRIEIGETAHDDYLNSLIKVARGQVEDMTGRRLIRQTVKYYIDAWPRDDTIELPYPPFSTETAPIVTYVDIDSSTITMGTTVYRCDSVSEPGRIVLEYNESWPTESLHNVNPIAVQYLCGYGGSSEVPERLKHAIKLVISDLYEQRETFIVGQTVSHIPNAVKALTLPYKIWKT